MADVNVPVGEPINGPKGAGYGPVAGTGAPGEPTRRKAYRSHHCLNFLLHLLTAMATAAALTTIYKSNQTLGGARTRWKDFTAFKFFLIANAVVLTYSLLAALASLLGICTPRGPLSFSPFAWLTFLMDFLLANGLIAAAASATTIYWIERRGQANAGWAPQCGTVDRFCRRVLGAVIACYIGWVFLALSTLLAAAAIHRNMRRRHALSY